MANMEGVLTREQLDTMKCGLEPCNGNDDAVVYLRPACHIDAPVITAYVKDSGNLRLSCSKCGSLVTLIQVTA